MAPRVPKELKEAIEAERRAERWHERHHKAESICSERLTERLARGAAPPLGERLAVCEAIDALAYTRQWHVVNEWAEDVASDFPEWSPWPSNHDRVTRIRAQIVEDIESEEEAFDEAVPIFALHDWLSRQAPGIEEGGRRRVVIRIFAWVIDRENDVAYDAEWLKVGDDMSALAADARALRWARAYDQVLQKGQESREIRMTALEILWWTRAEEARLV